MKNSANGLPGRRWRAAAMAGAALILVTVATGAQAETGTVSGGSGILSTFIGDANNPGSPDLNAKSASVSYDSSKIYFSATMAGAIGLTAQKSAAVGDDDQGLYIWGVDRGKGTAVLNTPGNPLTNVTDSTKIGGSDIKFDAFIVLGDLAGGHGDGFIAYIGDDGTVAGTLSLDATNISYAGDTIDLVLARSDLPLNGFSDISQFGFNIWPRYSEHAFDGLGDNLHVASFLPGDHNFNAAAVPEPASWAIMIVGFGLAGSVVRAKRRRGLLAA
jgi:hypothetical protein